MKPMKIKVDASLLWFIGMDGPLPLNKNRVYDIEQEFLRPLEGAIQSNTELVQREFSHSRCWAQDACGAEKIPGDIMCCNATPAGTVDYACIVSYKAENILRCTGRLSEARDNWTRDPEKMLQRYIIKTALSFLRISTVAAQDEEGPRRALVLGEAFPYSTYCQGAFPYAVGKIDDHAWAVLQGDPVDPMGKLVKVPFDKACYYDKVTAEYLAAILKEDIICMT